MIVVVLMFLLPATVTTLYYFMLTMLSGQRTTTLPRAPKTRFVVLVPAHNEALMLPKALRSISETDYPPALVSTLVVADNCTDETAELARKFGAAVVERSDEVNRGKGYALSAGLDRILPTRPDAVIVLDADCRLAPSARSSSTSGSKPASA